jgi:hypothetical protein
MSDAHVYAPPLINIVRWLARERQQYAFVAEPSVARWSPYNDDAFINAINEWYAMRMQHPSEDTVALYRRSKIPFIEQNRPLWQNIYTVCVAALTAAHAFLTSTLIGDSYAPGDSSPMIELVIKMPALKPSNNNSMEPVSHHFAVDLIGPTSAALRGPNGRAGPAASILDGSVSFCDALQSSASLRAPAASFHWAPVKHGWQAFPVDKTTVFTINFRGIASTGQATIDRAVITRTYGQLLAEPEWTERMQSGNIVRFRLDVRDSFMSTKTGLLLAHTNTLRIRYDRFDVWDWFAGLATRSAALRPFPFFPSFDARDYYIPLMEARGMSAARIDFIQSLFGKVYFAGGISPVGRFIDLCQPSTDSRNDWTDTDLVTRYYGRLGLTDWILPPDGGPVELVPGLTRRSHAMFARPATTTTS